MALLYLAPPQAERAKRAVGRDGYAPVKSGERIRLLLCGIWVVTRGSMPSSHDRSCGRMAFFIACIGKGNAKWISGNRSVLCGSASREN